MGGDMGIAYRTYKKKGVTYAQIVNNFRDPATGKSRTTSLKSYGNLDKRKEEDPNFEDKIKADLAALQKDQKQVIEAIRDRALSMRNHENSNTTNFSLGIKFGEVILRKKWEQLELNRLFSRIVTESDGKIKFDLDRVTYCLTSARISTPGSKKQCYLASRSSIFDYHDLTLDNFYDSLYVLSTKKNRIISFINKNIDKLYSRKISIALYDVTTFYFESFIDDELRKKGLSKDHKYAETQVVLGLLIDSEGIPIDYQLFPGNTHEICTLLKVLSGYLKQYGIQDITIIADCGLNSKQNIVKLSSYGKNFIVTQSLRKINKSILNNILDISNPTIWDYREDEFDIWRSREIPYTISDVVKDEKGNIVLDNNGKKLTKKIQARLIVNFSAKRYKKDIEDLAKAEEKARKYLSQGDCAIDAAKARKYELITRFAVDEEGNSTNEPPDKNDKKYTYGINEKLIAERKKVAGYYAFITNNMTADKGDLYGKLRTLWKIEMCFRIMKTFLEARPVFVHKKEHIEGHFVMCYLALVIERLCIRDLKEKFDAEFSTQMLVDFMDSLQLTRIFGSKLSTSLFNKSLTGVYAAQAQSDTELMAVSERVNQLMECFGVEKLYNCEATQSIASKFGVSIPLNPIMTLP